MRAVADRAGVNERTVYRHFTNERGLRDAVMHRLEEQAGIDLSTLRLEDIADVAASHLRQRVLAPAPAAPAARPDPHRGEPAPARGAAPGRWPRTPTGGPRPTGRWRRRCSTSLWGVAPYERLVADWGLDPDQAVAGITWVIGLIEAAVREGRRPN